MKKRSTLVALVATFFALATPLAYADDDDDDGGGGGSAVASLNGVNFISQEVGQGSEVSESIVTGECNPLGTSTFGFTVTGVSAGLTYPGTFTEIGTLATNPFGIDTSFESTFTINSPAGTVTGSKSLVTSVLAICGNVAIGSGGPNAILFEGNVSYSATITTPNGSRMDSGTAFVSYGDSDVPPMEGVNGHSFTETFVSNDPGGGGGGGDDDDDDDD